MLSFFPTRVTDNTPVLNLNPGQFILASDGSGTVEVANGTPGQVPLATTTSPSAAPVQSTALPTPTNVQADPTQSTVLTSAGGSIVSDLETILLNPTQHLLAIAIILVVGWWLWKHV